jgi:hypothetical protein
MSTATLSRSLFNVSQSGWPSQAPVPYQMEMGRLLRFSICLCPNSVYLCCCGISTLHSVRCVSSALCDCRICCSMHTQLLTSHISIHIHHCSCAFMASHEVPTISIVESDTVVRSPVTSSAHQSTDQAPVHQANCTKSIKIEQQKESIARSFSNTAPSSRQTSSNWICCIIRLLFILIGPRGLFAGTGKKISCQAGNKLVGWT